MKYANIMRIFRLFFFFFLLAHWIGCLWHLVQTDIDRTIPVSTRYLTSTYDALLMLVGNNVGPSDRQERVFVMVVMFLGACFNACIFGNMAVLISNMDKASSQYRDRMDVINEYMRYSKLPFPLVKDIRRYYDFVWIRQRLLMYGSDPFSDLSLNLRKRLSLHQYRELIVNSSFLLSVSPSFLEELVLKLKPKLVLPMVCICYEGEVGHEMFFINKGKLEVFVGTKVFATLKDGDVFGEISLLLKTGRRCATIRSQTYCDLYTVTKADFDEMVQDFPEDGHALLALSKTRLKAIYNEMDARTREKLSLKNIDDHESTWKPIGWITKQEKDSKEPPSPSPSIPPSPAALPVPDSGTNASHATEQGGKVGNESGSLLSRIKKLQSTSTDSTSLSPAPGNGPAVPPPVSSQSESHQKGGDGKTASTLHNSTSVSAVSFPPSSVSQLPVVPSQVKSLTPQQMDALVQHMRRAVEEKTQRSLTKIYEKVENFIRDVDTRLAHLETVIATASHQPLASSAPASAASSPPAPPSE